MKEIITETYINAEPSRVWEALTANEQWYAWNPFITQSTGNLIAGRKITNTMAMPGRKPMTFKPTVLKAEQDHELRWLGRVLVPGIFDGEHYFKLEADGRGTRFVQGEVFSGLLVWMLDMDDVRKSFVAMNEALKKRVEG